MKCSTTSKDGLVQSHENRYTLASDCELPSWGLDARVDTRPRPFVDWTELHRSERKRCSESAQPILLILQWAVAAKRWKERNVWAMRPEEALTLMGIGDMWAPRWRAF